MDNTFPRSKRIRKSFEFKQIKKSKSFFEGRHLLVEYCLAESQKLGLTIPKWVGKAVTRVALKRKIREVFRTCRLPNLWINVKPKSKDLLTFQDIKKDFEEFIDTYHHLPAQEGKKSEVYANAL